jgi:serine/threonine protein kinase
MMFVKHGPRVAEEAAALRAVRHPGVVELVDVVDGALRTARVDGRSLADLPPLRPDEVAGVAAAVATTLADLHEMGVVHGGIEAAHVLVGADGRIVLCSLGRPAEAADDVAALGLLVTGLLEASAPGPGASKPGRSRRRDRGPARLGALLAPPAAPELAALAARAAHPDPARRPSAWQVAAFVHQRIPTARLPVVPTGGPALDLPPHAPVARRRRRAVTGAVAATGLVVGALLLGSAGGDG